MKKFSNSGTEQQNAARSTNGPNTYRVKKTDNEDVLSRRDRKDDDISSLITSGIDPYDEGRGRVGRFYY